MKPINKIITGIICLAASLIYQFYFENSIVIIDNEFTDFLSGVLFGLGISFLVYGIFNRKKNRF